MGKASGRWTQRIGAETMGLYPPKWLLKVFLGKGVLLQEENTAKV